MRHDVIDPAILYFGTPVVLVSTVSSEDVPNLASVNEVGAVDRLALTTGRNPVPKRKRQAGYRFCDNKFAHAGVTTDKGDTVRALRVLECPVNLEGHVNSESLLGDGAFVFQIEVSRVHVHPAIRESGTTNRINPDTWRPLLMSFTKFYGLGNQVHPSRLLSIDEEWYR